ncbi:hypothetical protein [Massilia agri]|uniref:Uncharacterized protein n=1 Tax=Massilia agri TaxID=1886785 RepID=A0ABT2AS67_9BURK|nr:hypothetical protein [Massilia agri]MCS0599094.1 hypothetical protein [Massilia agri]
MIAEPISSPSSLAERIFVKTDKGRAEILARSASLNARQRSVLIMVDGRKSCRALMGVMPADSLLPIVDELAALELIALARPPGTSVSPLDLQTMAQAKAMMIGSAEICLGLLAAEVVRQVEQAADEEQLLRALGHWHMAMQASKRGRVIAPAQLESIKSFLRQPVCAHTENAPILVGPSGPVNSPRHWPA